MHISALPDVPTEVILSLYTRRHRDQVLGCKYLTEMGCLSVYLPCWHLAILHPPTSFDLSLVLVSGRPRQMTSCWFSNHFPWLVQNMWRKSSSPITWAVSVEDARDWPQTAVVVAELKKRTKQTSGWRAAAAKCLWRVVAKCTETLAKESLV